MEALRISPRYTSTDWNDLDVNAPRDWPKAVEIVQDRLDGRFLAFATKLLKLKYSGFVVLAIDCLMAETIQQFKEGITNGDTPPGDLVRRFLEGNQFQPKFDEPARKAFYRDIRCGLLHQAEARKMWLIRRRQPALLEEVDGGKGYIIDVERFHAAVLGSLADYLKDLVDPTNSTLRSNLWAKMNQICSVRMARGAMYEDRPSST